MARSTISSEQWELAREYFEHGLGPSDIEKRTGITKGAISKKSKAEKWDRESPKKRLLSQAVEVSAAKETLKETAAHVHNELHEERTKHLQFLHNATLKNVSVMAKKINEKTTVDEHKKVQDTIHKAGQTLGVIDQPGSKVEVNNTNAQQNIEHMTKEEIMQTVAGELPD
jgi:hypothetical protein